MKHFPLHPFVQPYKKIVRKLEAKLYGKKKLLIGLAIFYTFVSLFFLELFSVILIKKLGWNYEPAYLRILKGYTSSNLINGRTEDKSWGTWNVPHYTGRIANNCFDITYKFNSYGARDKERKLNGENRTLVFGDSFTEGWGVDQDKIITAQLEKLSGKEFLNFGISGSGSGPLNQYILYRDFAQKFEHDAVVVGFYPGNDFKDNDPEAWQGLTKVYYRPFWKLSKDKKDIEIVYFKKQVKGTIMPGLEPENKKAHFSVYNDVREFSALFNVLTVLRTYKTSLGTTKVSESAYNLNVSDDALAATLITYNKFAKLISDNEKYIFVIPAATDVRYYFQTGKKDIPKFELFKKKLTEQGWTVIDTMNVFGKLPEDELPTYFICDGHWNDKGDELAAREIYRVIKQYK